MKTKNSVYLVLTIIFVILSVIGGYFLYQIINQQKDNSIVQPEVTPIPTVIPTETPIITLTPTATASSIASSSTKKVASPTATIKPTSTPKPTLAPTIIPTATLTPSSMTYTNTDDGFSVDYLSTRKVYPDTENSGRRYTFYLYGANFAIHVGLDDQWAWSTPNRNFSGDFLVAGQNTYRYDISTQTIVDIQHNGKNYTLQCIHNGKESIKAECEEFISSFQFL